jgi:hypothetical protein
MKVVWQDRFQDRKQAKKRVTLYWLYKCEGHKRRYICCFLDPLEAERSREHLGNGFRIAKRTERAQKGL